MSGWKLWWSTRKSLPKYLCFCPLCCDSRTPEEIEADLKLSSSELSVFDGHSFGHVFHGVWTSIPVFFVEWWIAFLICLFCAIIFEFVENSSFGLIISKWKICNVCSQGSDGPYKGDNLYNSIADVFCNLTGFLIMYLIHEWRP